MKLTPDIIRFFAKQGYVMISTIDADGHIHCSAKGIVGIELDRLFIVDLFKNLTYKNIKSNPRVSITAINEHEFKGYTLQGQGKIILHKDIEEHLFNHWEDKIVERITSRMIKGVQRGVKSVKPFEAHLPQIPKYVIEVDIEKVIDLIPPIFRKTEE